MASKKLSELESFQHEHQRLLRALILSLDQESQLHGELRRLKESIVSISLRFYATLKAAQDDEIVIYQLRKETEDCRTEALEAKKQATVAGEMIQSLKLELNILKKKLSEMQSDPNYHHHQMSTFSSKVINNLNSITGNVVTNSGILSNTLNQATSLGIMADKEVDEMFQKYEKISILPSTGGNLENATSFQKWKIHNFIYTSDAPGGSEYHDKHIVDKLAEMTTQETLADYQNKVRHTKSSISRIRGGTGESRPSITPTRKINTSYESFELPRVSRPPTQTNTPTNAVEHKNFSQSPQSRLTKQSTLDSEVVDRVSEKFRSLRR